MKQKVKITPREQTSNFSFTCYLCFGKGQKPESGLKYIYVGSCRYAEKESFCLFLEPSLAGQTVGCYSDQNFLAELFCY